MIGFREKQGKWFTNQPLLLFVLTNYSLLLIFSKNETFGCGIRINWKIQIF